MSPSETTQPGGAPPAGRPAGARGNAPGATQAPARPATTRPVAREGARDTGRPTARVEDRPGAPARPEASAPTTGSVPVTGAARGEAHPRRVRLTAARINPFSVAKLSFLLSVALGIVAVVAVFLLWSVLNGMGVFSKVDSVVRDVVGSEGHFNVGSLLSLSHVLSVTVVLAVADVVILTVLCTLGAILYNIASSLVGGLRLTLSDD